MSGPKNKRHPDGSHVGFDVSGGLYASLENERKRRSAIAGTPVSLAGTIRALLMERLREIKEQVTQ